MALHLEVLHTATNRVVLVHRRDGVVTSRYDLPAFPQVMRLTYAWLGYTIEELPYRVPGSTRQEGRHA